jgi:hypothetical protein
VVLDSILSDSESKQLREYGHRITPAWSQTGATVKAEDEKAAAADAAGEGHNHRPSCPPDCATKENLNMLKSAFLGQHVDTEGDGSDSSKGDGEGYSKKSHAVNTQREHLLLLRVVERLRRTVQHEHGLPPNALHPASIFMTQISNQLKV